MRRAEKEIREPELVESLLREAPVCRIGLCSLTAEGGYPYLVPVHFAYHRGRVYFHSAKEGKKMAILAENDRVCVEVDELQGLIPAQAPCKFGSRYRSVIAFGRARVLRGEGEKRRALDLIMTKYAGRSFAFSAGELAAVALIEIELEQVSGKKGG